MSDPIMVRCEGSGARGHRCICPTTHAMCPMCGEILAADAEMPEHDRQDILAMLARGDFDG